MKLNQSNREIERNGEREISVACGTEQCSTAQHIQIFMFEWWLQSLVASNANDFLVNALIVRILTMWNRLLIWWHIHVFWCIARQNEHEHSDTDTRLAMYNCHCEFMLNANGMSISTSTVTAMPHFIILNGENTQLILIMLFSLPSNWKHTHWHRHTRRQAHAQLSFIPLRLLSSFDPVHYVVILLLVVMHAWN